MRNDIAPAAGTLLGSFIGVERERSFRGGQEDPRSHPGVVDLKAAGEVGSIELPFVHGLEFTCDRFSVLGRQPVKAAAERIERRPIRQRMTRLT